MSNIGVITNNPGNLLTLPGGGWYPGQTGVYHSPNGLSYPQFGTPAAGQAALLQWLQDNIGTDPNTSLTNLGEVASYYLNGSYDPLTNTTNNPHAASWLKTLEQATGLDATTPITPSMFPAIASGIEKAEGTYGAFGAVPGTSVSTPSFGDSLGLGWGAITSWITGQNQTVNGQTITPGDASNAIGNASGGVVTPDEAASASNTFKSIGTALTALTAASTWERIAVVALAVILLAGGVYLLGRSPPVLLKGT